MGWKGRWQRRQVERLRAGIAHPPLPRHVGLVMDGNRRWARSAGMDTSDGHRAGAAHVDPVLAWCRAIGIRHVTVYLASTHNLRKRDPREVALLLRTVEEVVADRLAEGWGGWQVHLSGRRDVLPASTAAALVRARDATAGHGDSHLTLAIGYDGREEVVDAVRAFCRDAARAGATVAESAGSFAVDDIAGRLSTDGRPDPDLVIRTSGERRLSGFLMWQSERADLDFCDVYWPGFRELDFLRTLRAFGDRRLVAAE